MGRHSGAGRALGTCEGSGHARLSVSPLAQVCSQNSAEKGFYLPFPSLSLWFPAQAKPQNLEVVKPGCSPCCTSCPLISSRALLVPPAAARDSRPPQAGSLARNSQGDREPEQHLPGVASKPLPVGDGRDVGIAGALEVSLLSQRFLCPGMVAPQAGRPAWRPQMLLGSAECL